MGASRPSPTPKIITRLLTVTNYAKPPATLDEFYFRGEFWRIKVSPLIRVSTFRGMDALVFIVVSPLVHGSTSAAGNISVEILDKTGQHAVFRQEERLPTVLVTVSRRMLEEELSCVRGDGTLTIRWTLSADMKPATNTTGMEEEADGWALRRRPNVVAVGIEGLRDSPRRSPSAYRCPRRKIATPTAFYTPTAMPSA
jgi:hypothetical protein